MTNTSLYINVGKLVDSEVLDLILEEVWDKLEDADKEFIVDTLKIYNVNYELYPKNLITMAD